MAYSVEFTPVADKDLDNLTHITITRILKRIQKVRTDPRAYAKPLKAVSTPTYSLRVGDYRVLFELDDETMKMNILMVRHRSIVYRDI